LIYCGQRSFGAAESEDRGRQAKSPAEIPAKGWKDILLRVYGNIGDHRILALAAGMTYYSILAIFPALAALVSIYGLFSDPGSIAQHLDEISGFVPGGAVEVAREQLTRVATKGERTLGLTFAVGLAISLWSANAAMKSLFDTLNIVYGEREKRGSRLTWELASDYDLEVWQLDRHIQTIKAHVGLSEIASFLRFARLDFGFGL
jgi:membrane protein